MGFVNACASSLLILGPAKRTGVIRGMALVQAMGVSYGAVYASWRSQQAPTAWMASRIQSQSPPIAGLAHRCPVHRKKMGVCGDLPDADWKIPICTQRFVGENEDSLGSQSVLLRNVCYASSSAEHQVRSSMTANRVALQRERIQSTA